MKLNKYLRFLLRLNLSHSQRTEFARLKQRAPIVLPEYIPKAIRTLYNAAWRIPRLRNINEQANQINIIYQERRNLNGYIKYLGDSETNIEHWQAGYYKAKSFTEARHVLHRLRILDLEKKVSALFLFLKAAFFAALLCQEITLILYFLPAMIVSSIFKVLILCAKDAEPDDDILVSLIASAKAHGIRLDDALTVIHKPIPTKACVNQLATLTDIDIPHEFCCAITHEVMRDPVYSAKNPMRFDRAALMEWLKKRQIHPYTQASLFPSELIRDLSLKHKIEQYAEEIIQKSALQQQTVFKPETTNQNDSSNDLKAALSL